MSLLGPHLPDGTGCLAWLSGGRDAYLLVSRLVGSREWFLPEFLCPVVPRVLTKANVRCIPYRMGGLKDALAKNTAQSVVVMAWDVGG